MSVYFLYPALLAGLAAASLPVLIHLLNRRRLKRIRFPAVRFILLSQKRISRSFRLRHWLLLALRTLAVVLLALLLANPIFQIGAGLFAAGGPVSLVLIIDNSLSMNWSGNGKGFEQAKEGAKHLIAALSSGDRAVIIPTGLSGKEPFRLKSEKEILSKEIDQLKLSDGVANHPLALAKAYELLREAAGQREIRIISDLGLTGWDRFTLANLKQVDMAIPLKILRVGSAHAGFNGSVKEIRVGGNGIGVGLPLGIEATVSNFGDREIKELLVQLMIDGQKKEQKLVAVPARGETAVNFQTRLSKAGSHAGQIVLKREGLAGNSANNFVLDAQDKLRVLVVDGDPRTSLVQSDTFFLARALNPGGESDSSVFLPHVIVAEALPAVTLDSYQAVILCNVANLPDAFVQRMQDFVRQGGGVLIFGGDRLQAASYNTRTQLLPAPLGERKVGVEATAEKIAKFDAGHPALQFLTDGILQESLKSTKVWGYFPTPPGRVALISLANGTPLLLEQKLGNGKLLVFTSSADRDWTDLPIKTVFLPLIQGLTQYLAGGKRGRLDSGIEVGAIKEIVLPAAYVGKSLRVTKPDKQTLDTPVVSAKEQVAASFGDNDRAGFYRLSLPPVAGQGAAAPQLYAVNPPFLESRLDTIGEAELQAKLKPIRAEIVAIEALKNAGKQVDLALPLLALLMVTLLFEGWLGQRF